jgi:hypothetical protein
VNSYPFALEEKERISMCKKSVLKERGPNLPERIVPILLIGRGMKHLSMQYVS